ncbi:MAG: hypothetical protein VSS75_033355 [Candidatus Parabeggiatoa sp.]|nr:hypothetical protein [Candidatus Parabeggiatoa sp.]
MKMKKFAAAVSLVCAGLAVSPATWAAFPEAGVDNVPSLAQFKVTFTKEFAFYLKEVKGAPFCTGYSTPAKCPTSARTYTSPKLYEANTKVGRSGPHRDGDDTDEWNGADICKDGNTASCTGFFSWTDEPILDAHFQWKDGGYQADGHPYDEGPKGREEVHTQVVSFKLTPLNSSDRSANAVRAGDQAPCQARSLGEVESLNGDGFPAESFFQMYVDVDVDMNNDGKVDMVLFNQPGIENTIFDGDPLIIESTGLKSFPPKVIYSHTGRTSGKDAPKLYVRGADCKKDANYPGHVGWLRIATHGIDFAPASNITRGKREGARPDQCQAGETDVQCFDRVVTSLPMMPIPQEEDGPFAECPPDCQLVELDFLTAVSVGNNIALTWATASEIDNAGFHILRARKDAAGNYIDIVTLTDQLIPTQGVSHNGITYSYVDSSVVSGNTYYYAIEDVDFNGKRKKHLESIASVTVK